MTTPRSRPGAGLLAALFTAALGLAAGSCFDPPRPVCAFLCGPGGECPDGYRCASDQWCKREDVAPSLTCDPAVTPDARSPDAEPPDAEPPDAEPPDAEPPDAEPPDAAAPNAEVAGATG